MRANRRTIVFALAAVLMASAGAMAQNDTLPRNCPLVRDQTVLVPPGVTVGFHIFVVNPAGATISPYQYPAGGILQQTGPFDFVFVPRADFNGTTTFTYRLNPPFSCPQGLLLGTVHLAGGNAGNAVAGTDTTATGLIEPPEPDPFAEVVTALAGGCGAGFVPFAMTGFALIVTKTRLQRRPRRVS